MTFEERPKLGVKARGLRKALMRAFSDQQGLKLALTDTVGVRLDQYIPTEGLDFEQVVGNFIEELETQEHLELFISQGLLVFEKKQALKVSFHLCR